MAPAAVWRSSEPSRGSAPAAGRAPAVGYRSNTSRWPVGGHRLEREQLRRDRLLQVDHQAHHARLVLADAHAGDVGVVGRTLPTSSRSCGLSSRPSMSTTSRGGFSARKCLAAQRAVGLDRHARVVGRRPDAHRDDAWRRRRARRCRAAARGRRRCVQALRAARAVVRAWSWAEQRLRRRAADTRRRAASSQRRQRVVVARRDSCSSRRSSRAAAAPLRPLFGPFGELQAGLRRTRRGSRRRPIRAGRRSGRSRSATSAARQLVAHSYGSSTA